MILRGRIYFFPLLVALSTLPNLRVATAADLRKVTFSYSAVSMTWYPVKVALEKGFFRSEGLEPQLIQMNGNVATVALANGHIDFSLNISPVLNGAMQGLGTKLVAALNSRPLFALVVRPEINSPNDLKGKVFAVSSFGNTQAILTEKHLQHLGLKKGEYQLLAMGATPARIAALEKNIAQGSLMPLPSSVQLENKGCRLLGNTAEIVDPSDRRSRRPRRQDQEGSRPDQTRHSRVTAKPATYMAVSLPDTFQYPEESTRAQLLREVVLPACRELGIPLSTMIGVRLQVNPAIKLAGDAVGKADLRALENMCRMGKC